MKRVRYAGGSMLTGDAIADAVLDYATALARAETADHVVVPSIDATGTPADVDIVLGPASQFLAEREDFAGEELRAAGFVDELRRRTRLVAAGRIDQIDRPGDAAI